MNLLTRLYGDEATAHALDEESFVQNMIRMEQAVARAQGELGIIPDETANELAAALDTVEIDYVRLWRDTRNVGYPVLPLVRQIDEQLAAPLRGYLHWGLTTQDVMDTALVLQLRSAAERQASLILHLGDALDSLVQKSASWPAAARTHAQHAVPTTMGARWAVFLAQLADLTRDWSESVDRISVLSMHGAGGTSAALGPDASEVRAIVARSLGLEHHEVPWHVARQSLARLVATQAALAATCARLAKEVIDLSRNEIGEMREQVGHLRGASSTMPQKANPIDAEAVIGLAWSAIAHVTPMTRAFEAGHERAAGEWQIEWSAVPGAVFSTSSALAVAVQMCEGLQMFPEHALANLDLDHQTILAEAYMMQLALALGREDAHDVVYAAVRDSAAQDVSLHDALGARTRAMDITLTPINAQDYLGHATTACTSARAEWSHTRGRLGGHTG